VPNLIPAVAPPQNPLGELTAVPQVPWLDLRGLFLMEGRMGRKCKGGEREREEREREKGCIMNVGGWTPLMTYIKTNTNLCSAAVDNACTCS